MKKYWLASFLVLSLLGVGIASLHRGGADGVPPAPPKGATPSNSVTSDGLGWELGARYTYDFTLGLRLGLSSKAGPAQNDETADQLELSGVLHTTVLARQGERVDLAYEIASAQVHEGTQSASAASRALAKSIESPFFIKLDEQGAVTTLSFAPDLSTDAQTLLRNLVATLRVPRARPSMPSSTELELDPNGECNVRYSCQGETCSKERLGYVRVASARGLVAAGAQAPRIIDSHFGYATDRHGRLVRMLGKEVGRVDLAGAPLTTELTLVASLKSTSIERSSLAQLPLGPQLGLPTAASAFARNDRARLPADLRGATPASLMAEYMKLSASDRDGRGRSMARLSSLLHHDPSAAMEAARLIRAGAPGSELLAEALGGAHSAEGQTALASVIGDEAVPANTRAAALRASLLVEQPSATLVEALRKEMNDSDADLRNRARVAFGASANHLSESEPALAQRMTGELISGLDAAKSNDERIALLRALGNTGQAAATDALLSAAGDRDPAVREAAMRALRFCRDPRAAQVLSAALTLDSVAEVRGAALFAAEFQPAAGVVVAVGKVAKLDPDNTLRGEAIRVLGKLASDNTDALQALTDLSSDDPDPELRALAGSLLNHAITQTG